MMVHSHSLLEAHLQPKAVMPPTCQVLTESPVLFPYKSAPDMVLPQRNSPNFLPISLDEQSNRPSSLFLLYLPPLSRSKPRPPPLGRRPMGSIRSLFRRRRGGRSKASSATASSPTSPTAGASDELERVFKKFDSNGDGKISSSELAAIFESLGHPASDEELERMMSEADADGDGFISFDEFVDLNVRTVDDSAALEDLRHAFSVFDLDRNGSISADELARVLRSIGEGASVAQCKRMIDGVDRDGDGLVSFEEFKLMMANGSGFPLPTRSSD